MPNEANDRMAAETPFDDMPLCVDLDGTLIDTDTLHEQVARALHHPGILMRMPFWLLGGKARFKDELAKRIVLDPATLPYKAEFREFLEEQRKAGRRLFLTTAANERIARDIAAHLDLFEDVIASGSDHNLKGSAKARALAERFGDTGFSYAGNSRADLDVWQDADAGVFVNLPKDVDRKASILTRVEARFARSASMLRAALRALRPHQWVKNLLIFVPIVASGQLADLNAWLQGLLLFASMCMIASTVYIVNDVHDLDADRAHPRKRRRPFASGALPLAAAGAMAVFLVTFGVIAALACGALLYVLGYAALSLSYSAKLKEYPLVDVFVLAGLYTIRMFMGGMVTDHPISFWLLGFSGFLFLSLAIIKRVAELENLAGTKDAAAIRRGYLVSDRQFLWSFGTASTFASGVILALYVGSDAVSGLYTRPQMLWGIVPLVIFWQGRLWLATSRGTMDDDPIVFTFKDWVSRLVGVVLIAVVAAAHL